MTTYLHTQVVEALPSEPSEIGAGLGGEQSERKQAPADVSRSVS